MISVSGIRIPLEESLEIVSEIACRKLGIANSELVSSELRRVSYDSRHGSVSKVCSVLLELKDEKQEQLLCEKRQEVTAFNKQELKLLVGNEKLATRPVIVGFGPSGMFAAYLLSEYGFRPVVIERGEQIEQRVGSVEGFFKKATLNAESNVQFGEGGAGTFSDGKLTTRINDPLCDFVLDTFVGFGAPKDILYKAKPHIGTDKLRSIVKAMREKIIANGGEIHFCTRLEDIEISGEKLSALKYGGTSVSCDVAALCCGHSARDTFAMLSKHDLELCAKSFSVGARIEHLQEDIDRAVYGRMAGNELLPKGEYALSTKVNGRGVYTFCMCPGGIVVAAASENGTVAVNGMSEYARDGKNANSAVAVSVDPADFGCNPFDGLELQRNLERKAFELGGGNYQAPAQDLASLQAMRKGLKISSVQPSYPIGTVASDFRELFGEKLCSAITIGIAGLGKRLHGFDNPNAILTAIETRTSSPIRIVRGENREATKIAGLYPCGEGAGYAGGIVSAAVDGLKTAVAIIEKYKP